MTDRKLFGTDGIRGIANTYPLTAEMTLRVGQALAAYFTQKNIRQKNDQKSLHYRPRIIIGKDTRRANYMVEQAIASGICSMGVDALLLGPTPTPGISFLVTSMRADAGVVISASHNSFEFSGIKVFGSDGFKLPDEEELKLEALILQPHLLPPPPLGADIGRAKRLDDVLGRYIVHTKAAFSSKLSLEGLRIVIDCAHGAAYKVAPTIFQELGAEVFAFGVQPDGTNINEGSGALFPQKMSQWVREYRADIGIALDGDADRVICADERGHTVGGDTILGLLAIALKERNELEKNTIVGSIMCNLGLRRILHSKGIHFLEVPVGDRYIVEELRRSQTVLGGEPSGHIIFRNHASTGDGILTALKLLEVMVSQSKKLSELSETIQHTSQVLENVKVKTRLPIHSMPQVQETINRITKRMGDAGRVLVRYSGTEPVVRVMVEGDNPTEIKNYAEEIAHLLREAQA